MYFIYFYTENVSVYFQHKYWWYSHPAILARLSICPIQGVISNLTRLFVLSETRFLTELHGEKKKRLDNRRQVNGAYCTL